MDIPACTPPDPARIAEARLWLAARDPLLHRAHALVPPFPWRVRQGGFAGLIQLIVEQQVSTASAAAIWARLQAGLGEVVPAAALRHDEAALKAFGLSAPKARYVRGVAEAQAAGRVDLASLSTLDDEAAIEALVSLKGIGRWSAEVYLLFCEGRLDAFPAGDLALQEAVRELERAVTRPSEKALYARGAAWRPYRGVACHLLWDYYLARRRGDLAPPDPCAGSGGVMRLDGPRVDPADGGLARKLVIFAHGYGSNGEDLIGLASYLAQALPDAAFVAPNAPQPVPGLPGGHQWFPLAQMDPGRLAAGVRAAAPVLDTFIDAELARLSLAPGACALVGFSQGAMMALHVSPRRKLALGGVVALSGLLAAPEHLVAEIASRPPIMLCHGDRDDRVPPQSLFMALDALAGARVPALWRLCGGAGHTIPEDALALTAEFLHDALNGDFTGWEGPGRR